LDETRTVRYWKKVAFNIVARMVLNSYWILYKENYREPDKLKSNYSYAVSHNLELEGGVVGVEGQHWADDPLGPQWLRKLPENNESQCIVCSTEERRWRARTGCTKCNKGLHGECFPKHRC
jgi:hypothetical protein